jgi:hypothetical protein
MVGQAGMRDIGIGIRWHVTLDAVVLPLFASLLHFGANLCLMARFAIIEESTQGLLGLKRRMRIVASGTEQFATRCGTAFGLKHLVEMPDGLVLELRLRVCQKRIDEQF